MNRNKILYLAILIAGTTLSGFTQYFANPSFEDTEGINRMPESWKADNSVTTPDIGPISCEMNMLNASEGDTYLILTTRDDNASAPGSIESVTTSLGFPLEPGYHYTFEADLSSSEHVGYFDWENGYIAYNQPVSLIVWWGTFGNDRAGILLEAGPVTENTWKTYAVSFVPEEPIATISIEMRNSTPTVNGNICIDNLRLRLDSIFIEPETELFIPNVFTPNNDGVNDIFSITGFREPTAVLIFDDHGRAVFRSENYKNDWDGRDENGNMLAEGNYWYVIIEPGFGKKRKGNIYLKRE
jgi:gliding motility-associated-like protein